MLVQNATRRSYNWPALPVFLIARLFPDDHQRSLRRPFASTGPVFETSDGTTATFVEGRVDSSQRSRRLFTCHCAVPLRLSSSSGIVVRCSSSCEEPTARKAKGSSRKLTNPIFPGTG